MDLTKRIYVMTDTNVYERKFGIYHARFKNHILWN